MEERKKDDLVGRHLIVDASTYTRRNLTSTDTVFALFEALNRGSMPSAAKTSSPGRRSGSC